MSWLTVGLDAENVLIAIEFASRGRTAYRCPYCQGELTAKKGSKKALHFTHTHDTCGAVR
ncbi:MAG: GIY-YIG nuclease family protein, partial [Microcoleus sp. SIO2G3]|nr:GIY-YIG nuclease family protein [Microcoleus sp. SIO2G3]